MRRSLCSNCWVMTRGSLACDRCGHEKIQQRSVNDQANELMRLAEATTGPAGYGVSPAFETKLETYLKRAEIHAVEQVLLMNVHGLRWPDAALELRQQLEQELKVIEG